MVSRPGYERIPKVLAFASRKGGVGKSECARNVAWQLAELGFQVCVIDVDDQSTMEAQLGLKLPTDRLPFVEALKGRRLHENLFDTRHPNLAMIPSDPTASPQHLEGEPMRGQLLHRAMLPFRAEFDVIVIDTPPNSEALTWNALFVADRVIIPMDGDEAAQRCLEQTLSVLETVLSFRDGLKAEDMYKILVTRVTHNDRALFEDLKEYLTINHPGHTLRTVIGERTAIKWARKAGLSIFEYAKAEGTEGAKTAAKQFEKVTEEIVNELKIGPKNLGESERQRTTVNA